MSSSKAAMCVMSVLPALQFPVCDATNRQPVMLRYQLLLPSMRSGTIRLVGTDIRITDLPATVCWQLCLIETLANSSCSTLYHKIHNRRVPRPP
ncbi:hypothetical protein F5Y17DRAFT_416792 [Xylariaceae sp. FL0594]|nr:hypothetical protein F5Y17DRAFT_416792 [Xylariaceae sp. FL0594]